MSGNPWTEAEENLILRFFPSASDASLMELLPGRSLAAIRHRGKAMSVARPRQTRLGDLSPLLKDTPESLYWMGFLLADGYFTKDRLKVRLAKKDEGHLKRLSDFIGGPPVTTYVSKSSYGLHEAVSLSVMHKEVVQELRDVWGIVNQKTYFPPNLERFSASELTSILIGFIDGDGCIKHQTGRSDTSIQLKNHHSWLGVLQLLSDAAHRLSNTSGPTAHVIKDGFAVICMCKAEVLRFLKSQSLTLPAMQRKWGVIDDSFVSRAETSRHRDYTRLEELMGSHLRLTEIAKILQVPYYDLLRNIKKRGLQRKKASG